MYFANKSVTFTENLILPCKLQKKVQQMITNKFYFLITFCFKFMLCFYTLLNKLFLKITVAIPWLTPPANHLLEQGFVCPGYAQHGFQTYESNIDFEIRYVLTTGKFIWNIP